MTTQNSFSAPEHITVLLHEAVNGLALKENGIYIDGTFGRGGHSRLILSQLSEHGRLIAVDRDPRAIAEAEKIQDPRFHIEHNSFSHIPDICQKLDLVGKIDGILLDLGVSSPQLDEAERGFSFMKDGPLDMRMDTTQGLSAAEWLKQVSIDDLTWVLKTFGEERFAKRIATAIVEFNKSAVKNGTECLSRTSQLAELIAQAVPFKDKHKHPATRSFQAIRIYINAELDELESVLNSTMAVAIRFAKRSSPKVFNTQVKSSTDTCFSHSAADKPCVVSMRISNGPSFIKLKPRSASSSCGDDTPKSSKIPSILPTKSSF